MKKFILTLALLLTTATLLLAVTKSQVVVYINGQKYYIHTVEPKETIYSIAKAYQVSEQQIIDNNSEHLKAGQNIKIPYSTPPEQEQGGGLRNLFKFSKHQIKKGDTLYSISRLYEISIETIMEDNPQIDPITLPEGQKLLIRKKMKGKSNQEQSLSEWKEYRSELNLTTQSEGYKYHIVEQGETIYSLSKAVGISEAEFIEINKLESGLKAGAIIKYPIQGLEESHQIEQDSIIIEPVEQIGMRSLSQSDTLKVALLLPLTNKSRSQRQFADFYQGFVAGLDSLRSQSARNIELTLYNTDRNIDTVYRIVEDEQFEGTDLIVGPIYEELLAPVLRYAEQYHTPVVSPLATLKESRSSVLFQLAPPTSSKYDKVANMLAEGRHVTLIYTEQTDSLFESTILEMMQGREWDTHIYEYEHPNVVAEKIKEEEESASDLSKFINNDKDNTIVVLSSNQTDVDRILSALSSAQINIVARGGKSPRYEVLGNSEWSRYKNIDRTVLFKNNVVLVSLYHAKRDSDKVKLFDSNYIKEYGALPSLYSYRGFDAAMIFGEAAYGDIDYKLEGRRYTPLQSDYIFKTDPQNGIHINTEWIRVNYKNNFTITIE